ncbi:MAG: ribonuclease HII [Holosporaceae bacterium]|jgi:ribonuclease HII|nr:ribonuclease HII [Holosporaceae bacterium]
MNLTWYDENEISPDDSIGIDEVGRGPLAGPVVAAAVWIRRSLVIELAHSNLTVRDSKKMTANQRKKVVNWIKLQCPGEFHYSIATVTAAEIDKINILRATLLAMEKSHKLLGISVGHVLVDGDKAPNIVHVHTIIKGDNKVPSISLASIIAKEYRDDLMRKLALKYPCYGWETNVGYGTKEHLKAIFKYGVTPHHRQTFSLKRSCLDI